MAEKQYWIGSTGPFTYDDSDTYGDGENHTAFRGEGVFRAGEIQLDDRLVIGDGEADYDPYILFDGETKDGYVYWMEDEDYFEFKDDIFLTAGEHIYLRDTAISIRSSDDGHLDFYADISIDMNSDVLLYNDKKFSVRDSAIGIYSQADTYLDMFADGSVRIGDSSSGAPTNYTEIKSDGEINLHGTARVTSCCMLESTELSPGSSGATQVILGNYVGYSYGIGDDTVVTIPLSKLQGWEEGTNLTIKIRYYINEAYVTNNGEVQWQVLWSAVSNNGAEVVDAPAHSGTIDSGDFDIPATAKVLKEETLGTISDANLTVNDELGLTLSRVILDGGSNPAVEPVITCLGILYTRNKLGIAT